MVNNTPNISGRYQLLSILGKDEYAERYHAIDNATGGEVTYKLWKIPEYSSAGFLNIRSFFAQAASIQHENIIPVHQQVCIGTQPCVVSEYLSGKSLNDIINSGYHFNEEEVLTIADTIAHVLHCLEKHRICCGSIKPSNIIVPFHEEKPVFSALKISDVMQARILYLRNFVQTPIIAESIRCMAPEQLTHRSIAFSINADMYSLGVILYLLVSRHYPFDDPDISRIIYLHESAYPQPLPDGVPHSLQKIIYRLLEKNPAYRHDGADHLLHDIYAAAHPPERILFEYYDRMGSMQLPPPFVGRERESAILKGMAADCKKYEGAICLIYGVYGIGKTRLLKEFHEIFEQENPNNVILSINLNDECSHASYYLLGKILEHYADIFIKKTKDQQQELKKKFLNGIETIAPILVDVHPAIRVITSIKENDIPPLEGELNKKRLDMVLGKFLRNIIMHENGLLIIADDCEKADYDNLHLIADLIPYLPNLKMLFIAAVNTSAGSELPAPLADIVLNNSDTVAAIKMEPLNREHHRALIAGTLTYKRKGIHEIADAIYKITGGVPLFSIELTQKMVEDGVLICRNKEWELIESNGGFNLHVESLKDFYIERFESLSTIDRRIIEIASVLESDFSADQMTRYLKCSHGISCDVDDVIERCNFLASMGFFKEPPGQPKRYRLEGSGIGKWIYEKLEPERLQSIHQMIGEEIEKESSPDGIAVFSCAHHFMKSSDIRRGISYCLLAGELAMKQYAYHLASIYLQYAATIAIPATLRQPDLNALQARTRVLLAETYLYSGNYHESISILENVCAQETPTYDALRLMIAALMKKGDFDRAGSVALRALAALGEHYPQRSSLKFFSIVKEAALLFISGILPRAAIKRTVDQKEILRNIINIYLLLLEIQIYRDIGALAYIAIRIRRISLYFFRNEIEEGISAAIWGVMAMLSGRYGLAARYYRKSSRNRGVQNNLRKRFYLAKLIGIMHYWRADKYSALNHLETALNGFQQIGEEAEVIDIKSILFDIHWNFCDFNNAGTISNELYHYASTKNDHYVLIKSCHNLMILNLALGKLEIASKYERKIDEILTEIKDPVQIFIAYLGKGEICLHRGDYHEAVKNFELAMNFYNNNSIMPSYGVIAYTNLADSYEALYRCGRSIPLDRIRQIVSLAITHTKRWPLHHGKALRCAGVYYFLNGKRRKAIRLVKKSINHNHRIGMKLEEGRSLFELGKMLQALGNSEQAHTVFERAFMVFDAIGAGWHTRAVKEYAMKQKEKETSLESVIHRKRLYHIYHAIEEINSCRDIHTLIDVLLRNGCKIFSSQWGLYYSLNSNIIGTDHPIVYPTKNQIPLTLQLRLIDNIQQSIVNPAFNRSRLSYLWKNHTLEGIGHCSIFPLGIDVTNGILCFDRNEIASRNDEDEMAVSILCSQGNYLLEKLGYHSSYNSLLVNSDDELNESDISKIQQIIEYIEANFTEDLSREGLAALIDLHPDQLGKLFKRLTGKRLGDYLNELRVAEACAQLEKSDTPVIEIAFSVGFESLRTFNRVFTRVIGVTPSTYRQSIRDSERTPRGDRRRGADEI